MKREKFWPLPPIVAPAPNFEGVRHAQRTFAERQEIALASIKDDSTGLRANFKNGRSHFYISDGTSESDDIVVELPNTLPRTIYEALLAAYDTYSGMPAAPVRIFKRHVAQSLVAQAG